MENSKISSAALAFAVVGATGLLTYYRNKESLKSYIQQSEKSKQLPEWSDFVKEEKDNAFGDVPKDFNEWDDEFGCYTNLPRRVIDISVDKSEANYNPTVCERKIR